MIELSTKPKIQFDLQSKISLFIIVLWGLIAIFAPALEYLIGYGYAELSLEDRLLAPLSKGAKGLHMLGTDVLGRDIFAGLVHGARVAFVISSIAVFLSLSIGLTVGLSIGYYGDTGFRKNFPQQVLLLFVLMLIGYYGVDGAQYGVTIYNTSPIILAVLSYTLIDFLIGKLPIKKYGLPLDMLLQRIFEIRESLPALFLILAIVAIVSHPSIYTIAMIVALLYWITFARHARAETMVTREEDFVRSAVSSGIQDHRVMIYHILPNILPSIAVIIAFSFSGIILLEASLSFLGIGIPLEEVSWGKILAGARSHPQAWWLAVFPGLSIFLILYACNTIGDYLSQYQRRDG